MKIVLAPDSFKHSLTAQEAAEAMGAGLLQADSTAEILSVPIADGGEGTLQALLGAGGEVRRIQVTGGEFKPRDAFYVRLGEDTAVIEMANICGLMTVKNPNPEETTTLGVGEAMRHALDEGCRKLVLCIGGSASNDGGMGVMTALGARFLDGDGKTLSPIGRFLGEVTDIDVSGLDERLKACTIQIACDVDNPLCGSSGAAAVYGPQKGADKAMVQRLDRGLAQLARVVRHCLGQSVADVPGMGAAGGFSVGLYAFCGAQLQSGVDIVLETVGFEELLRGADLVFTGEGMTDNQTLSGKAVMGVMRRCQKAGVPVVVLSGAVRPEAEAALYEAGALAVFPSVHEARPFSEIAPESGAWLSAAARNILRMVRFGAK